MGKSEKQICGIIMPISPSDDEHTASHWEEVKDVITEAIERADCKAQPVWEGGAHDIIQAKILQNIYENPIVVCDLSTRNPNVMLEIGMRLTTKKPTLLIAEDQTPLPFDTGIIHTEFYSRRLDYRATKAFIEVLAGQISEKLHAHETGEYHPYLEAFEFETVEPPKRSISSVEHLTDMVTQTNRRLAQLDAKIEAKYLDRTTSSRSLRPSHVDLFESNVSNDEKRDYEFNLKAIDKSFVEESLKKMPKDPIGWLVGHKKFGIGTVIEAEDYKITVQFDEGVGNRKLLGAFLDWLSPP